MGKKNKKKAKPVPWADDFAENKNVQNASEEGQPEQISLEQPSALDDSEPAPLERKPTDEGYVSSNEPPSPSLSKAAMAPTVPSVTEEENDDGTKPIVTNFKSTLDLSEVGETDFEGEPTPIIEMPDPVIEQPGDEPPAADQEEDAGITTEKATADEEQGDEPSPSVPDPPTPAAVNEVEEASTNVEVDPVPEREGNDNESLEISDLPTTEDVVVVKDSEEAPEGANDEASEEPAKAVEDNLEDDIKPEAEDVKPEEEADKPEAEDVQPEAENVKSEEDDTKPEDDTGDKNTVEAAKEAEEDVHAAAEESPEPLMDNDNDNDMLVHEDVTVFDETQEEDTGVAVHEADKDGSEAPQAAEEISGEAEVIDEVVAIPDEKSDEPAEADDAPVALLELADEPDAPEAATDEAAPDAPKEDPKEDDPSVDAGDEADAPEAETTVQAAAIVDADAAEADAVEADAADADANTAEPEVVEPDAADVEDVIVANETPTEGQTAEEPVEEESTEKDTPGAFPEDAPAEVEQEAGEQPEPEQAVAENAEVEPEAEAEAGLEGAADPEPEAEAATGADQEAEADTTADPEPEAGQEVVADEAEGEPEAEPEAEEQKDDHTAKIIAAASVGVAAAVAGHEIKKHRDKKRDKYWEREPASPTSTTKDGKHKLERSKDEYKPFISAVGRQIEKAKSERDRRHETDDYKERLRRRHEKRDAREAAEAEERRKRRSAERKAEEIRWAYETAMQKKKDDLRREAEKREKRASERKHKDGEESHARPPIHKHPTVHGNSSRRSSNGSDRDRPALLKRITTGGESDTGGPLLKINMAKAGGYDPQNVPQSSAGSPPRSIKSPMLTRAQAEYDSTSGTDADGHRRHRHRRRHHDRHGMREESIETSSRMDGEGKVVTREKLIRRVTSNDKEYYGESPGKRLWRRVQEAINA